MKVFISADIEGVAGITDPTEADPGKPDYAAFRRQMTREVAAACEGAVAAGAKEILVKDAHWTGRNIDPGALPECAHMVRGWTGHPYSMMTGLDKTFDATVYVGYHSRAGSGGNPLAHTMSGRVVMELRINDQPASEFLINTLTSTLEGVPVAFLSGDEDLCEEVVAYNDGIRTFSTLKGVGTGTFSIHPEVAVRGIREAVQESLERDLGKPARPLPDRFKVEIDYKQPKLAYGRSFFPGCELVNEKTVRFETSEYFEALRMMSFCIKG